jgi:transposase-like protein
MVAVRSYLRYGLSYRDVEELLAERGVEVDHGTVYRWVHRFTPLFADAARLLRHAPSFVQNLRRGHYELATDVSPPLRLATAFSELALAM